RIGRRDKRSEKFQVRPRDWFGIQYRSQWGKEVIPNDRLIEVALNGLGNGSATRRTVFAHRRHPYENRTLPRLAFRFSVS
ncbi:MAG: hypothetical protein OXG97_06125, partial [Candidatus Poribacteria bacterium]|nr:hypothetical protein [Candidatus Poribacteria bacterium]